MMGNTHRIFGFLAGAAVASAEGATTTGEVVIAGLIASAVSHGSFSPDMDQTDWWRSLSRVTQGAAGMGQHRHGLSHWWGVPVIAWWYIVTFLPDHTHWAGLALVAGWTSHLLGDLIFGTLSLSPTGHGPRLGLGLKTDGFLEAGKVHYRGREWTVIPFGPTKVLITVLSILVVWFSPDLSGYGIPQLRDLLDQGIRWVIAADPGTALP